MKKRNVLILMLCAVAMLALPLYASDDKSAKTESQNLAAVKSSDSSMSMNAMSGDMQAMKKCPMMKDGMGMPAGDAKGKKCPMMSGAMGTMPKDMKSMKGKCPMMNGGMGAMSGDMKDMKKCPMMQGGMNAQEKTAASAADQGVIAKK